MEPTQPGDQDTEWFDAVRRGPLEQLEVFAGVELGHSRESFQDPVESAREASVAAVTTSAATSEEAGHAARAARNSRAAARR